MCKGLIKKLKAKNFMQRKKILIIDDDPIIRQSTKNLVKSTMKNLDKDYEILEGCDGIDLMEMVTYETDNLIRLILTDEDMVNMLGSEAIRAISGIKISNNIDIVSITASNDFNIIYNSGADMVFNKPVDKNLIENVFKSFNLYLQIEKQFCVHLQLITSFSHRKN